MGMTSSPNGWSEAFKAGLPTYIGRACKTCGCIERATANKQCINKCYLAWGREYKAKCKAEGKNIRGKIKDPEKIWKILTPNFRPDNLKVLHI